MAFTFGTAAPATNNTFGGFGTSQATTTPAFGQTSAPAFGSAPATSTPFGGTATGFGTAAAPTGGFSFGSTSTAPTNSTSFGGATTTGFGGAAAPTGGFSFGSTSTAPTTSNTGFGFGNTSTTPAASTSGFTFGGTSTAPAGSTGGFSFGATSATPAASTGGFGFGTTSTAPAASTGGFGFGATSTAPAASTGGFGFGAASTTANSTGFNFGSTSAAPSTTTLGGFGSTNTGFGGFGANKTNTFGTTSLFGNNTTGQNTNQQGAQQVQQMLSQADLEARAKLVPSIYSDSYRPDNVWQALALLRSWWDPKSPHCRFKHYFYNVVEPQEVQRYQKPADHDQAAWDAAQAANPDPTKMVPALAVGFDDIQKRMDEQHKMSQAHLAKLAQLQTILKEIQKKSQLETVTKLNEYKRRHMETVQRVINFLKYAQVLRNKGLSITPEEENMRSRLESLQEHLQRSEQFRGKLSQLWAQLQLIKESGRMYGQTDDVNEWDAVSEENMTGIKKILEEQDKGVHHIINVLEADSTEIDNIYKAWKGHQQRY